MNIYLYLDTITAIVSPLYYRNYWYWKHSVHSKNKVLRLYKKWSKETPDNSTPSTSAFQLTIVLGEIHLTPSRRSRALRKKRSESCRSETECTSSPPRNSLPAHPSLPFFCQNGSLLKMFCCYWQSGESIKAPAVYSLAQWEPSTSGAPMTENS